MTALRNITLLMTLLLLASCGGGGGGGGSAPPPTGGGGGSGGGGTPPPPSAVDTLRDSLEGLSLGAFYDVSYKALLARDPEQVVSLGLDNEIDVAGQLTDISRDYALETIALHGVVRDALNDYDRAALAPADQITWDVYAWYLDSVIDDEPFIDYHFLATYSLIGEQSQTQRFFTDIQPVENESDAEAYLARLRRVDDKFLQLTQRVTAARDAGIVEPALTMNVAIQRLDEILALPLTGNPYFTTFNDKVGALTGVTSLRKNELRDDAISAVGGSVIPAYQNLRNTLANVVSSAPTDIGVGQYPQGDAFYAERLAYFTSSSLTPAEVHQLGLDALVGISAALADRFATLGYPAAEALATSIERVSTDGGVIAAADALGVYEALIDAARDDMVGFFNDFPAAEVVVIGGPTGGFYIRPSLDGSRPGAFYASTVDDVPYFTMPTLTYHEALPGHHYQIALAMEQDVPLFRKVVGATSYIEGWGLYAERVASDLGWYSDDIYGDVGRLHFEALRAARLVIDTGIHAFGWTFDEATDFGVDNVGTTLGSAQGAAARYSVWPGQATAYYVGLLKMLELRDRAQTELGGSFDLAAFHEAVIDSGAVPLEVLETIIDDWIAAQL
ncbi:MAG: DUF885 domain-containing protein [Pseudomonadota bacterium]